MQVNAEVDVGGDRFQATVVHGPLFDLMETDEIITMPTPFIMVALNGARRTHQDHPAF